MRRATKKQQMLARIEQLGGMDVVLDRIAACETLTSVAGSLGVARHVLGNLLNKDPQWRGALRLARQSAADALAEEALEIADRATNATAGTARLQINARIWLAARYHPEVYGRQARQRQGNRTPLDLALRKRRDGEIGLDKCNLNSLG